MICWRAALRSGNFELTGHNPPAAPLWREVNVREVRVERVREYG